MPFSREIKDSSFYNAGDVEMILGIKPHVLDQAINAGVLKVTPLSAPDHHGRVRDFLVRGSVLNEWLDQGAPQVRGKGLPAETAPAPSVPPTKRRQFTPFEIYQFYQRRAEHRRRHPWQESHTVNDMDLAADLRISRSVVDHWVANGKLEMIPDGGGISDHVKTLLPEAPRYSLATQDVLDFLAREFPPRVAAPAPTPVVHHAPVPPVPMPQPVQAAAPVPAPRPPATETPNSGVPQMPTTVPTNAIRQFEQLVGEAQRQSGLTHSEAVRRVAGQQPDLHRAMLLEANQARPAAQRQIQRAYA